MCGTFQISPKIAPLRFFLHFFSAQFFSVQWKQKSHVWSFDSRKRAEAEGRKGSFPCSKAMSSHHPTDPVELRRINFQTPGEQDKRTWVLGGRGLGGWAVMCVFCSLTIWSRLLSSLPCVSVPRLPALVKSVGFSRPLVSRQPSRFFSPPPNPPHPSTC